MYQTIWKNFSGFLHFIHSFNKLFSKYLLCTSHGARNMKVSETNVVPNLIELEAKWWREMLIKQVEK